MAQIIPKNPIAVENNWQKELAMAFTDPDRLLSHLQLDPQAYREHSKARRLFPMRVPRPFVARMSKGNPDDPLLRQVLPLSDEFVAAPGFGHDPLQEQNSPQKGLLHKYHSRVLLLVRGGCAVNCRYCFRRHFPYADNKVNKQGWLEVLDYIRADHGINEVIYSGGDPLMANDEQLAWLTEQLQDIPHLTRLRIHTRLPVVIPSRITPSLIDWFARQRLKPVMVLHINHSNEIDKALRERLAQLRDAGVTLLNQAVLLRGINDSADAQVALSEALFAAGVLPYYLHMLDKVDGASHFDVQEDDARNIMAEVIKRQPGFLVPKLVREIGGQPGKTLLDLHLQP
ncbi:EF-P beta-lysylation protein EpmB [Aestuariibacter halophilus]|uniref:L-lysine 2,3-aminomutase n=1 Tax=Fluctibacter halophilus TaxID=226011 RepID=A0ABS8GBG2_9ALTE|nr:EF-P beta-lysylation protein EpmB [Aestuariibacter halophilus]MCC2617915.1 EF-P beta-lysylation protein EpmB [Aestuariibacter halophilus]